MTRVVSLLPAGTEIVCALGAGESLVGRSHECDWPPGVRSLPVVSRPTLELDGLEQSEIDAAVARQLQDAGTLYAVDEELLRTLEPDVVLTQDLCQVCAPSGNELTRALADLPRRPEIVWLTPRSVAGIFENFRAVGRATGRVEEAERLVGETTSRIEEVRTRASQRPLRAMVFLEWIDPYYSGGHWVPEMIACAGGRDPLGRDGADSVRVNWDEVVAADPSLIVVSPCGYALGAAERLARSLPAIGVETWAVDANAYFARPGPRLAEGTELLASILHPAEFGPPPPDRAVRVA